MQRSVGALGVHYPFKYTVANNIIFTHTSRSDCVNTSVYLCKILSLGRKLYKVLSRGVWGHVPRGKFGVFGPLRLTLMQSER